MLKVDETYTDQRVRWNPKDNKLYGLCYEHGRHEKLCFEAYHDAQYISELVKNGEVHMPKETMVLGCSTISTENCKIQVVAALPTCNKSEVTYQANLNDIVSSNFAEKNDGAPLLNWSTDGDPTCRKIFNSLVVRPRRGFSNLHRDKKMGDL